MPNPVASGVLVIDIYILVGVREELGVHFGMLFGEQESWEKEENPSAIRIVE